jgi:hypothetical protein
MQASELRLWAIDNTMDAVTHVRHIEIQQQAQFVTGESQMREQLGLVNRQNLRDALDFD